MTACFLSVLGAHCATRASQETTASHPDRHADGEKQSHCLVRAEQTHFYRSLRSREAFVDSHHNRHENPALP